MTDTNSDLTPTPEPQQDLTIMLEEVKQALSYISLGELCSAMAIHDYSAQSEIAAIIAQAQDSRNPTQQLAAIKMLHTRRMEALKNSGAIVTATESVTGPDGVHRTLTTNIVADALLRNRQVQPPVQESDNAPEEKETKNNPTQPQLSANPEAEASEPATEPAGPRPVLDEPPSDAIIQALPGLASRTERDAP